MNFIFTGMVSWWLRAGLLTQVDQGLNLNSSPAVRIETVICLHLFDLCALACELQIMVVAKLTMV
jgi:hypothetical protein